MTIYDNPQEYAKQTRMTLEQSEKRCNHFKQIQQRMYEASKCPECSKHTLTVEGGSYEEGSTDYVYCTNEAVPIVDEGGESTDECDYTSEVLKEYEILYHWNDFDPVLSFSMDFEKGGKEGVEKFLGCTWDKFIADANQSLKTTSEPKR